MVWGVVGAVAALWLAGAAHAETEAEYGQGPFHRAPATAGQPSPAAKAAVPTAKPSRPPGSTIVRRSDGYPGYAAESARNATRLPPEEREARGFLRWAATAARFEAQASRLATTRAQRTAVREFAANLLEYHESADAELLHLLHGRSMALPMVDNVQRKALNRLAKLSGEKFDREYIELVAQRRQREEIQHYQKALAAVSDPVLKRWIDGQLPSLRQQMAAAGQLSPAEAKRTYVAGVRPSVVSARSSDRSPRQRVE
jgi:putative membrane protein